MQANTFRILQHDLDSRAFYSGVERTATFSSRLAPDPNSLHHSPRLPANASLSGACNTDGLEQRDLCGLLRRLGHPPWTAILIKGIVSLDLDSDSGQYWYY
jgi:hypothetical protein